MSEKRFVLIEDDLEPLILDNKETMSVKEVVNLLNEQQNTISKLEKENEQLKEELNNLKKDETMLYHYYTLARYGGEW